MVSLSNHVAISLRLDPRQQTTIAAPTRLPPPFQVRGLNNGLKRVHVSLPGWLTATVGLARMTASLGRWAVMLTIGLTGGIGTGKSVVANLLVQQGASIIDADRLGHEAYTPHSEAWEAVVAAFGTGILTSEGEIDRRKLGGIVFADETQLERLNGIMHPLMAKMVEHRKAAFDAGGVAVTVVEAAVLFEAGWAVGTPWSMRSGPHTPRNLPLYNVCLNATDWTKQKQENESTRRCLRQNATAAPMWWSTILATSLPWNRR